MSNFDSTISFPVVGRRLSHEYDFGICDHCGNLGVTLYKMPGGWLCHDCALHDHL